MQRPSVFHALRVSVPVVVISALVSCSPGSGDESVASVTQPLTNSECANLDLDRSLIVRDRATLDAANFSLRKTLKIIGNGAATPEKLLGDFIATNAVLDRPQPVSGLILPLDLRPEASLTPEKLLDEANTQQHLQPIALVNRFDLAPADAAYCGEHRIIYGRHQNGAAGRLFLIFEAALPNPHPELGIEGCKPVADFWANLSSDALFPTPASRATALEQFYYTGLPGFEPVVKHAHYGSPFGQIRSNQFVNSPKWQLREWRAGFEPGGAAALVSQVDAETPLAEFYDSQFIPGSGEFSDMQPALFASERAAFQNDFVQHQIPLLATPELSGHATTAFAIVNGFGSSFPARFLEFQSDATGVTDDPLAKVTPGFSSVITAATPAGLTASDMVNRATSTSCGGCHQVAAGRKIGKLPNGTPVFWPQSAGFVHVTETGALSPALQQFFLPARAAVLKSVVCPAQCEPKKPRKRCCFADSQCAAGSYCAGEVCTASGEGRCKAFLPAGQCWENADCGEGGQCEGAILCPCGLDCFRPDQPGQCASASLIALISAKPAIALEEPTKLSPARIEQARAADRAQPGAFVPLRRSH